MKKRILLTIIFTVIYILFMHAGISVFAQTGTSGDFKYTKLNGEVTITGLNTNEEYISIPEYISGCTVTKIASSAFSGRWYLKYVTIPDSITYIGASAFYGCTGLVSVDIKSIDAWCSIEFDGSYANPLYYADTLYLNGSAVKDLIIPDGVVNIEDYAFYNYDSLESVTIGSDVNNIGWHTFSGCDNLKSITIPDGVSNIEGYAFNNCISLKRASVGNGVTDIGECAFYGCSSLESLTIGNSVNKIGLQAFYNCSKITHITLPDSLNDIASSAFYGCTGLLSVSITSLEDWCSISFKDEYSNPLYYAERINYNGNALNDLIIPEGVTGIGEYAFANCAGITGITIPDSMESIAQTAFLGCTQISRLTIPSDISEFFVPVKDKGYYTLFKYSLINCEAKITDCTTNASQIKIPDLIYTYPVTVIADSAFSDCTGIESIDIPEGIKNIGENAFYGCTGLYSVTIPESIDYINPTAFKGCRNIETVYLPYGIEAESFLSDNIYGLCVWGYSKTEDGVKIIGWESGDVIIEIPEKINNYPVTAIGNSVFKDCSEVVSISIPESIKSIGDYAFSDCNSLTIINIPSNITNIGKDAFDWCNSLTHVNIKSIKAWCNIEFESYTSNPLVFADELYLNGELVCDLTIPETVENISNYAFAGYGCLKNVIIPDSVKSIGERAFSKCKSLENVTIGNGVINIGSYAFYQCEGLTDVKTGDGVTTIGKCAFSDCKALINVKLGNNIKTIGVCAFEDCSEITGMALPDTVLSIENRAFNRCTSLENIEIPDSVQSIGDSAFYECSGLENITIGNGVKTIGTDAFYRCNDLRNVYIKNLNSWCNIEFENVDSNPLSYAYCFYYNGNILTDLIIPDGITDIKNYTFYNCDVLSSVTIGNDVTGIGEYAFWDCDRLTTVILGCGISDIDNYAFARCWSINEIILPDSVQSIGNYAFSGCSSIENITVGNGVKSIGADAFYNCYSLLNVYISSIKAWLNIDFEGYTSNPMSNAKKIYLNGGVLTDLIIPDDVTDIGDYAFCNCFDLIDVTMGNKVTSIGDYAFYNCESLESIVIPDSLESIGNHAFDQSLIYYCGTKSEWNKITLGYGSVDTTKVEFIPSTHTSISDDGKTFAIESVNLKTGETVILALYNNGAFLEMKKAVYDGNTIFFTATKPYTNAKVMVCNDFTKLKPSGNVEIVK